MTPGPVRLPSLAELRAGRVSLSQVPLPHVIVMTVRRPA